MESALTIIQVVISVMLVIAILLQQQGSGLGGVFGGDGNTFRTKRGLEKSLFTATIILSVLFLGSGLATLIISS